MGFLPGILLAKVTCCFELLVIGGNSTAADCRPNVYFHAILADKDRNTTATKRHPKALFI